MVHEYTISSLQRLMHFKLIIEDFRTNIEHIYGFNNILDDVISTFLYATKNEMITVV